VTALRRKIGFIVAAVLGVSGLLLVAGGLGDDGGSSADTVEVLVVTGAVPRGAALADVRANVAVRAIPVSLAVPGALASLDGVPADARLAADLTVGEQVLGSRLVAAASLGRVPAPAGLLEVSVQLDSERALGGSLAAGDSVGVVLSFEQFNGTLSTATTAASVARGSVTHLTLHKVLVTSVAFAGTDARTGPGASATTAPGALTAYPSGAVVVTLALPAPQVEQVVFAAEFGRIWLAAEPQDATESGTRILALEQVYATTGGSK
jgi:pilus assembly protein CpaB